MPELRLAGPIDEFTDFTAKLNALNIKDGEELDLFINSPGGSVFEGFSIFNQLKALKNPINVKIESALSIAALIAMAGDTVQMNEVGLFMIHNASTFAQGNKEDLESQAMALRAIDETLAQVFTQKTGKTADEITEMLEAETFLTSNEALKSGFVDEIINKIDKKEVTAYFKVTEMKKFEAFKKFFNLAPDPDPEVKENEDDGDDSGNGDENNEENNEEASDFLTVEQFNKAIEPITGALVDLGEALKGMKDSQGKEIAQAVENLAKGVRSNGASPNNVSETEEVTNVYTPKFQAFREQIKEIGKNTKII